jgi:hypothetical protein
VTDRTHRRDRRPVTATLVERPSFSAALVFVLVSFTGPTPLLRRLTGSAGDDAAPGG